MIINRQFVFKNKIKELRESRGMTQTELAVFIGKSQSTVSCLELGIISPTAYLSGLICLALDCKWEECFFYE